MWQRYKQAQVMTEPLVSISVTGIPIVLLHFTIIFLHLKEFPLIMFAASAYRPQLRSVSVCPKMTLFLVIIFLFFFFFLLYQWHAEVPVPGIKPDPQQ